MTESLPAKGTSHSDHCKSVLLLLRCLLVPFYVNGYEKQAEGKEGVLIIITIILCD